MRIAVTGATGLVGHPVARYLAGRGHQVTTVGRRPLPGLPHIPWDLRGEPPDLHAQDHLVHAAFAHVPDRYRGGEGDDPDGFVASNLEGTLALWQAARAADVHTVFLSSRAVFDGYPAGTVLTETTALRPVDLYGRIKVEAEDALGVGGASIRATGVFGPPVPGRRHKWADLIDRYRKGERVEPRVATEVHSTDLARAIEIVLERELRGVALHASGFLLDRRDLLEHYARVSGIAGALPERSDPAQLRVMDTSDLLALGWTPSGPESLPAVMRAIVADEAA